MSIATELNDFGFETSSNIHVSKELGESSLNTLERLFSNLWKGESVLGDNDRVNSMVIRYAILEGLKNGSESIDESLIQIAKDKAAKLADTMGTFNIQVEEVEEGSETTVKEGKRTRNPDLYPQIKNMVASSPDAPRDEIVAKVVEEMGAKEGTATMYFYKARKELGLKNNGKRGRKAKA